MPLVLKQPRHFADDKIVRAEPELRAQGQVIFRVKKGFEVEAAEDPRVLLGFADAGGEPVDAGNGSPAAQLAATQATASEMERLMRSDPTQWNCFKPLWPNAVEQARLATRAEEMATQTERGAA